MQRTVEFLIIALTCCMVFQGAQAFVHPGCLSTQEDLDRMAVKVEVNAQPWKGGWDRLAGNTGGYLDDAPLAQPTINVGGGLSENYIRLAMDCAKAYQCALRYNISGDTAYGNKAVEILNAWKNTMTGWAGDTNVSLRAGIYGYQMACTAELMRDYPGWNPTDLHSLRHGYSITFTTYARRTMSIGDSSSIITAPATVITGRIGIWRVWRA